MEPVEAGAEDLGGASPQGSLDLGFPCLGERDWQAISSIAQPAQEDAGGEAEEVSRGEGGAEGELLGREVDGASEARVRRGSRRFGIETGGASYLSVVLSWVWAA
jgi:hypothetical protein